MQVTFNEDGGVRRIAFEDGITIGGSDTGLNGTTAGWTYQEPKGGQVRTVGHNSLRNCLLEVEQRRGIPLSQLMADIQAQREVQFKKTKVEDTKETWVRRKVTKDPVPEHVQASTEAMEAKELKHEAKAEAAVEAKLHPETVAKPSKPRKVSANEAILTAKPKKTVAKATKRKA